MSKSKLSFPDVRPRTNGLAKGSRDAPCMGPRHPCRKSTDQVSWARIHALHRTIRHLQSPNTALTQPYFFRLQNERWRHHWKKQISRGCLRAHSPLRQRPSSAIRISGGMFHGLRTVACIHDLLTGRVSYYLSQLERLSSLRLQMIRNTVNKKLDGASRQE